MIHIFYVPGMFGSMLEGVLMKFSDLDGQGDLEICPDGSLHSFHKQHHPNNLESIKLGPVSPKITTPVYPFTEAKLPEILLSYQKLPSWMHDKKILIHAHDVEWAEINMLFQWHKISVSLNRGLEIFGADQIPVQNWDVSHNDWRDMQHWQLREWLSLFYPTWIRDWIDSPLQVSDDFLVISNRDLLMSTHQTILRIMQFCGVNPVKPIEDFVSDYCRRQQYVIDEYHTIKKILQSILESKYFSWKPLSLIGESILQQHFRANGREWRCHGLDILPTNSVELAEITYQHHGDMHA